MRQLRNLDKAAASRIIAYMNEVAALDNPRRRGKALTGPFGGLWRYRIGDYRVVCDIRDAELLVLIARVGHRATVYR